MNIFFLVLGAIGISWIGYVYVGYPIAVWLIGLLSSFHANSSEDFLPTISVLISARNEEKDIGRKISETLGWNYPNDRLEVVIASDASDDKTDEIVRSVKDPRIKFLRLEERVGKNEALNRLAQIATGEFFFFTDANSHIPEVCARKMIRNFADPRVGCVTGADRIIREEQKSAIGIGENSYWTYETNLQRLESRLGSVLICFGAIFCIRKSLFSKLQTDLANDLELPIRIGGAGHAILYETEAWAAEKPTRSPNEEFARRRRICAQGLLGFWRLRECLHGLRAWQFLSRKFLRWTVSIPLLMLLFSSASLASNPLFRSILIAQILFYAAACIGWIFSLFGRMENSAFALPFYFVLVNVAALVGLIDACAGRRYNVWEVASMTRGTETL
jgi:cellulose synthase/poly-beta-1,6-N-acetylglucosamine synthase-like glycosyltransferase